MTQLAPTLQAFFTERLLSQRKVRPANHQAAWTSPTSTRR